MPSFRCAIAFAVFLCCKKAMQKKIHLKAVTQLNGKSGEHNKKEEIEKGKTARSLSPESELYRAPWIFRKPENRNVFCNFAHGSLPLMRSFGSAIAFPVFLCCKRVMHKKESCKSLWQNSIAIQENTTKQEENREGKAARSISPKPSLSLALGVFWEPENRNLFFLSSWLSSVYAITGICNWICALLLCCKRERCTRKESCKTLWQKLNSNTGEHNKKEENRKGKTARRLRPKPEFSLAPGVFRFLCLLLRSFICFNDSCFHARLLVEIQQQKRWRSEQRQRFLCCTRTEGSSICIRFCSKHTKFTARILRRRPFTSRRRDDKDHETVLAPYPIVDQFDHRKRPKASKQAYDLLDANLMPEYRQNSNDAMASSVGFCCSSSSSTFMSSQLFRHNNNVSLNSSVSGTCFPHTRIRVWLPPPQSSCYGGGDGAAAGKSTREWQSRGSPPPPPAPSLAMEVNAKRQNTFFTFTDLCSRIDLFCVSTAKERLRWPDILSSSCWWEGSCLLQCHSASPNHSCSCQKLSMHNF